MSAYTEPFLAAFGIPDANGLIFRPAGDPSGIGGKTAPATKLHAIPEVPQAHRSVVRPAGKALAVWRKRHTVDIVLMPAQAGKFLSALRVPDVDRVIPRAAGDATPVGGEGHAFYAILVVEYGLQGGPKVDWRRAERTQPGEFGRRVFFRRAPCLQTRVQFRSRRVPWLRNVQSVTAGVKIPSRKVPPTASTASLICFSGRCGAKGRPS